MKVSSWILPVLLLVMSAAGIGSARIFAAPSYEVTFERPAAQVDRREVETATFVIRGLKCVDTARTAGGQLAGAPGVLRFVAYASRNEARVTFDSRVTSAGAIRESIEGPVFDEAASEILFHQFEVVSINGRKPNE